MGVPQEQGALHDHTRVGARESVLVVEDDAAIAKVVCALLGQRGLDTSWVSSGEEAVTTLEARPFDVVLSDVRMPGMDGMALLDHVRAHFPDLPVVLVTAHGSVALLLSAQPWPGNVRQLQNFVERLVVLSEGSVIGRKDVERELTRGMGGSHPLGARAPTAPPQRHTAAGATGAGAASDASLDAKRRETEREALVRALEQADNNRTRAARILEVSRRTLYNKLREHGIA